MNPDRNREEALFEEALKKSSEAERVAFLDEACRNNPKLRSRLDVLLQGHLLAEGFLDTLPPQDRGGNPTVPAEVPVSEKPGDQIGRYQLLQKIGEGGFGAVYLAEQKEPVKRQVALKVIKLGMDTRQVVARFEAERQALALLDHPNIAKVLDAGTTENGRPYFVMELIKGVPITQYCDEHHLSAEARLPLFTQVCHAVQHAHQKGIIHRDLKPSNILVTLHDGAPVPKVIDFGIAKATQQELTEQTALTQFQQFLGTPAYMSPEQAGLSGLDIDTRSDIYSLGVLLYELLTGQTPFDAKELLAAGLEEMRRIIREQEPLRPSTRIRQTTSTRRPSSESEPVTDHLSLATDLDWIVMKCLEKDRRRRYETANGLAQDIERHLKSEPVAARPPSRVYRLQTFIRRNRVLVSAAAAVTGALVLGVIASTWQAARATKASQRADAEALRARKAEDAAKEKAALAEAERQRVEAGERYAQRLLYAANMNVAQLAWEQNNVGRVRQLLEETAQHPDRGFEWYYWQRQTHLARRTLHGFFTSAAFSPDGQRIVTGDWGDRTAKIWEASTGKELLTLKGHNNQALSVAFSPDGHRIVTGSDDRTARVWDAADGHELLTLKGHTERVSSVAFSPDGRRILTGSLDKTARVWNANDGKELLNLEGHGGCIWSVAYSPDGQRIVAGTHLQAEIWEAATGKGLLTIEGCGVMPVVAFSPDGQRIVTSSNGPKDQSAKVWDAISGRELFTLPGHTLGISSVAFSQDGQHIVTGGEDQTAKVWDATSGRELFTLKGHTARISTVTFSPDGQRVLTSSFDQTARLWDVSAGDGMPVLRGHKTQITSVAFSPDGQRIVTGSLDGTARVWNTVSGKELVTLKGNNHYHAVLCVAFSPDGQRILTGGHDTTAIVWAASTGEELLTLKGHSDQVRAVAFSPDGRQVVTGGYDRTAKVWDAASGKELLTFTGHNNHVLSAAFSPDGRRIVTGGEDQTARIWEASSGKELFTLKGHSLGINGVAFSADGQRIVTGSVDQTAKIWEASSGKELLTLKGHSGCVRSVAFSPDGRRIVTGGEDQMARIWEASNGKEMLTLKGHSLGIRGVALSPDGRRIVTGSDDETAKVWEAATAEQVIGWQKEEMATAGEKGFGEHK